MCDGVCQQDGRGRHRKARDERDGQALFEEALELGVILRAVVIAYPRRAADGVAHEERDEDELHVHQHTVGGHAVLTGQPH